MAVAVALPPDLEVALTTEASDLGLPLEEYVLRLLAERRTESRKPRNGKELVALWKSKGLIGTRPDIKDSLAHARAIRRRAERRERE